MTGAASRFDLKDYDRIDHGYAATIHKAQGMTVDRTHVLATPGLDAHGSYVALSRHRDGMDLHYGHDDFASQDRLVHTLSRDRAKDMASDYERPTRRKILPSGAGSPSGRGSSRSCGRLPEKVRDMFDGLLDGLRLPGEGRPGPERCNRRKGEERARKTRSALRYTQREVQDPREGTAKRPNRRAHPPCARSQCHPRDQE